MDMRYRYKYIYRWTKGETSRAIIIPWYNEDGRSHFEIRTRTEIAFSRKKILLTKILIKDIKERIRELVVGSVVLCDVEI